MTGTDGVAGEVCRQPLRGNGQLGIAQPAMAVSHRSSPRHHPPCRTAPGSDFRETGARAAGPNLMSSSILESDTARRYDAKRDDAWKLSDPAIITVIGASPVGPRPRPRRGRWSRLENRLGIWSRDSRLRLPRRASPGGRQLLCSRPSRRLEGRLLSDVAHDHLPRHADLVVVARLSNPHDGALVLTPPNHDSNLGPVVPSAYAQRDSVERAGAELACPR
jgi:hypothetical protein